MARQVALTKKLSSNKLQNIDVPPAEIEYAGLNRKVIAVTIDTFFVVLIIYPVSEFLSYFFYGHRTFNVPLQDFSLAKYFTIQFITLIIMWVVFVYCWIKIGSTPGKWATECKILSEKTMTEPTKWQYNCRFIGYIFSSLPFCLGFFAMCWDKKNRTWHDRLAGTVVVVKKHDWDKIKNTIGHIKRLLVTRIFK